MSRWKKLKEYPQNVRDMSEKQLEKELAYWTLRAKTMGGKAANDWVRKLKNALEEKQC